MYLYGDGVKLAHHAFVDVILNHGTEVMLGYDFLIAFDNSIITPHGAYPNPEIYEFPGSYEWEYFSSHFIDDNGGIYPSGLIQIISMADQNDGVHHPVIDSNTGQVRVLPENMVLFVIDFLVTNDYTQDCTFVPINFFWRDCTDNSIAMEVDTGYGPTIVPAISKDVFGYNGTHFSITDLNATLPTYLGAPDECLQQNPDKLPLRFIDFKNGGIKIICSDWECRGDVNLDGFCEQIEDVITFANYFVYGLGAFNINIEGQKASTDVNADGVPLAIEDLVYLTRLFTGDAININRLDPETFEGNISASAYSDSLVVESSFEIALGAVQLTLENVTQPYEIYLGNDIADMSFISNLSGDTLKVLIYGIEKEQDIPAGINKLLKVTQSDHQPKFISSQAAGYFGERLNYKTSIALIPDQIFLSQNYPNPFNSSTIIEFAIHKNGRWVIEIFNLSGQKVTSMGGENLAGQVQIFWDGTNALGELVSSGVYFYRLRFENQTKTKKMMLLK